MSVYKHLVVATDFSPAALVALRAAARLARVGGARVTLAHVFHPGLPAMAEMSAIAPAAFVQAQDEDARWELEKLRDSEFAGLPCELVKVAHASPALALCNLLEAFEADLCVVGTHGRTGTRRVLLGSVAERLVRHAPCDVLVVRREPETAGEARRIVAAIDLSPISDVAADRAHALALEEGGSMTVLYVHNDRLPVFDVDRTFAGYAPNVRKERSRELIERIQDRFGEHPDVGTVVVDGHDVAATIADYLGEERVQLGVVGTHGRTAIKRLLIGSVAERVVRLAPCSILVARSRPS